MHSDLVFHAGAGAAPLTIRTSSRAKVMRLRVDPRTGVVLLTIPQRASHQKAMEWVAGHRRWIEAELAKIPARSPIVPGTSIPYLGATHILDWQEHWPRRVRVEDGRLIAGGPIELLEARLIRWLKAEARIVLEQETQAFATLAGVRVTRVGIGDPVSRWGSCSPSGSIRYSWRLILAPEWVRRATVAHEVAHRIHMNHGPHFHALVKKLLGTDPAPARAWLKHEGAALHRFGGGTAD